MIFLPDEKNTDKKLLEIEIAELQEYAKLQGFTDAQTRNFVRNTVIDSIKSKYDGLLVNDAELEEMANDELKRIGIEL